MSFSFAFTGRRDAVIKAVKEVKPYADKDGACARAQAAVVTELGAIPVSVGVSVEANGHTEYSGITPFGNVRIEVKIVPLVE